VFVVESNIDSLYSNSIMLNFESIHPLHAIIHGNPRTNTWFIAPGTDDSNIVVKVNGVLVVFGKPVQMHENAQVVLGKITVTFNMVHTTQDAPSAVARDETTTHYHNGGKETVGPELAVVAAKTLPSTHLATKTAGQIERFIRREQAMAKYRASQEQIVQLKQGVPRLQNGFFSGTRTAYNKSHVISLAMDFVAYHPPVYESTILDSWVFVVESNIDSLYSNSIMLDFESIHPLHAIIHGNPRTNTWFIAPGTADSNIVVKVNGVLVVFGKPIQMHENAQVVLGDITVTFNMVEKG